MPSLWEVMTTRGLQSWFKKSKVVKVSTKFDTGFQHSSTDSGPFL